MEILCEDDCHFKISLLDKDTMRSFELNSSKRGVLSKDIPEIRYKFSSLGDEKKLYLRLNVLKLFFENNIPRSFLGFIDKNQD